MDRKPAAPPGGGTGDAAPSAELLAAVERASRHLGASAVRSGVRPMLRFDASTGGRRRLWVLGAILALSVGVAALTSLLRPGAQPAADVEADLRWAVANVVREAEAYRARTGALPDPERLRALLGEHLAYDASGGSYVVRGARDGVEVRFDGTVPLEAWLAGTR